MTRLPVLLAGAALAGCAAFDPGLTSAVPSGLTGADASVIAGSITDLTTQRVSAGSGALRVEMPPGGDAVLSPVLASDLRSAGYTLAQDAPHRLTVNVAALGADLLARVDLDGARATRLFTRTAEGLAPAGAFTVREASR